MYFLKFEFILIRGIVSRKIKLPYIWGLYFSISYIFFFSKRIITDTATDRTMNIIGILFCDNALGVSVVYGLVKCHGKLLKKVGALMH